MKTSTTYTRDAGLITRSGISPGEGNGNTFQYSCLGNPMDIGGWWATVHEFTKSRTRLSDWAHREKFSPLCSSMGGGELGSGSLLNAENSDKSGSSQEPSRGLAIWFRLWSPLSGWLRGEVWIHHPSTWAFSQYIWKIFSLSSPGWGGVTHVCKDHLDPCWKVPGQLWLSGASADTHFSL